MADVQILDFALTLEYLKLSLYADKARSAGLKADVARYAAQFRRQQTVHVESLSTAIGELGGRAPATPTFNFPGSDQANFLALAYSIENTCVAAYNGAIPLLAGPALVALAGSLVQVGARHAATLAVLSGGAATPAGAFDAALDQTQVLARLGPLIVQ